MTHTYISHFIHSPLTRYMIGAFTIILMLGVMLASTHTKEVMGFALGYGVVSAGAGIETMKKVEGPHGYDTQQKVSADLHNHVDKQTLKTLTKTGGVDTNRASQRELQYSKKSRIRAFFDKEPENVKQLLERALCLV